MLEIAAVAAGRSRNSSTQEDENEAEPLHENSSEKLASSPPLNAHSPLNGVVKLPPSLDFNAEMDRLHGIEPEAETLEADVILDDVKPPAEVTLCTTPAAVSALDILRGCDVQNGTTSVSLNRLQE